MTHLQITSFHRTDRGITDKHFGSNVITQNTQDQTVNGVPTQSFLDAIAALDVSDIRYPAGAPDAAYEEGILINGQLPDHLVNFMEAMSATGHQVVIVTPTFGSYTNAAEIQRFAELLLESYGPYIRAFEIGNEYWQQQGETAYGQIANESALSIAAARDATGGSADIWVQMANAGATASEYLGHPSLGWQDRTIEANKTIIGQLSEEALNQIDGVVEHGYFRETGQVFRPIEDSTTMIWLDILTWQQETGRDYDLAITEWNIKANNESQHGLKAASGMLYHFEHLIELGADDMHVWSAQHNTMTDLAGSEQVLFDADTGVVNNSVNGVIFDLMSTNLVGKELLDLTIAGGSEFINTHAYADAQEMVIYVASRSNEAETIQFSMGTLLSDTVLETALLIGYDTHADSSDGVRWSADAGRFVEADYLMVDGQRHYVNEHDARGAVDILDVASLTDGTTTTFTLKPYEVVQLTYRLSDREDVSGTDGNDDLTYTSGNQRVTSLAGADTIDAGEGEDTVIAGDGDDHVIAGVGNDVVEGGNGNDFLSGWGGSDVLRGGNNDDTLFGFQGNDTLEGGNGNDFLRGDGEDDGLSGGEGFDTLEGGSGNDRLFGDAGSDILKGGEGHDVLEGGNGFDFLSGGTGNDYLDGNAQNDRLMGDEGNDTLYGQSGSDFLDGGDGNDALYGGDDADRLIGDLGADYLVGGNGVDHLFGGDQNDTLDGGNGNDTLIGGNGDDVLTGGTGDDRMLGGVGADTFIFEMQHGHDVIADFDLSDPSEKIDLSNLTNPSSSAGWINSVQQSGNDVVISTGAQSSITIIGADADLLFANHLIL